MMVVHAMRAYPLSLRVCVEEGRGLGGEMPLSRYAFKLFVPSKFLLFVIFLLCVKLPVYWGSTARSVNHTHDPLSPPYLYPLVACGALQAPFGGEAKWNT